MCGQTCWCATASVTTRIPSTPSTSYTTSGTLRRQDIYQAFLYAFAFYSGHGPRQASLVYPSDRSEVNQRLAVRGSGITQTTIRGVRVNLSELVARAAVGPIVDPDLLMLCTGAANAQPIALPSTRLSRVVSG